MSISLRNTVVTIPAYNAEPFIGAAVDSVLRQHPEVRVLISDNESTDETIQRVEQIADARITIHRQEQNIGAHANINWLLEHCEGDVIALFCADDVMMPGQLYRQVNILAANDAVKLVSCNMRQTDRDLVPERLVRMASETWRGEDLTAVSINTVSDLFGGPSNFIFRKRDVGDTRFDHTWAWLSDFASRLVGKEWFANAEHTGYLYRRHESTGSDYLLAAKAHSEHREWAEYFLTHSGSSLRTIEKRRALVHDAKLEQRLAAEASRYSKLRRAICGPPLVNSVQTQSSADSPARLVQARAVGSGDDYAAAN